MIHQRYGLLFFSGKGKLSGGEKKIHRSRVTWLPDLAARPEILQSYEPDPRTEISLRNP